METPIALHSVAHGVSHQIPAESEMSRQNRPPKSRCRAFLRTPLAHFPLIRSRQGARRAGGGYRGTFGLWKRIALQGGTAATVTPVALLCATKLLSVFEISGVAGELGGSQDHKSSHGFLSSFRRFQSLSLTFSHLQWLSVNLHKSGVSADSRKSAKKCGKPHFLRKNCAVFFTQKKKSGFPHFLTLFLESAETPLFFAD